MRFDHVVNESAFRGNEWIRKPFPVLSDPALANIGIFATVKKVNRALGPHHGDLSTGPRKIDVSPQVLGARGRQ